MAAPALTDEPAPSALQEWTGRAAFEDLFVADASAAPALRGSLEEKVEYFRDKLRRAESQAARFRDAWQTRDREIDALENFLKKASAKASEHDAEGAALKQKLATLEAFVEQKKQEFEAYGRKDNGLLAQRDEDEKKLRLELEGAAQEKSRAVANKEIEIRGLQEQVLALQDELQGEHRLRQADNQALGARLAEREQELERSQASHREHREALDVVREELRESHEAFERDLALRNEAIDKLKASLEKQRDAIIERDTQIDQLAAQVTEAASASHHAQISLETSVGQLTADLEAHRAQSDLDIAARDEAIDKLKAALQSQREALSERDEQLDTLTQELSSAKMGLHTAEAELQAARDTASALQTDQQHQQVEMQDLQNKLDLLQQSFDEAQQALQASRGEQATLAERLQNVEAHTTEQVEDLNHAILVRNEAIDKLKGSLEAARLREQQLQEDVATAQANLHNMHENVGTDQERNAELVARTRKALEVAQKLLA